MYAVGHISLGYLTARLISHTTNENLNIPAVWTLSLLPDIDFLIPGLRHRGPTHSLIAALLIFLPIFITKGNRAAPYLVALATHSLIGDYPTGGAQLLWPLSQKTIAYYKPMAMGSIIEISIELTLFLILLGTLTISKDYKRLLNPDKTNALLFITLSTILLPITLRYPLAIPRGLFTPHLIMLGITTTPILISITNTITKK